MEREERKAGRPASTLSEEKLLQELQRLQEDLAYERDERRREERMRTQSSLPCCDTCQYWTREQDDEETTWEGECHRFPTVWTTDGWQLPRTGEGDWCGEHRWGTEGRHR